MIDFKVIREDIFSAIGKTNTIQKIQGIIKNDLKNKIPRELWKLIVQIPKNDVAKDFTFIIDLPPDFPVSLPKIYLSEDDYNTIKYIPHVDTNHFICSFDKDAIKVDIEQPLQVFKECVSKAIKIVSDGLSGLAGDDFVDEIVAYWENIYNSKDKVITCYTGDGIEKIAIGKSAINYLTPSYNNVDFLLLLNVPSDKQLIEFFSQLGHKVTEKVGFYLGEVNNLHPPFYFTNKSVIEFIEKGFPEQLSDVQKYLNSYKGNHFLLFSVRVRDELVFFGFYLNILSFQVKGWRTGSLTVTTLLTKIQPNHPVVRISLKSFSKGRIELRTDGRLKEEAFTKFTIIGIGSIGSHLTYYLSALSVSSFDLIDPEVLALENVNRHLLSYADVGFYKVDVMKRFLVLHNPFLNINTHSYSIHTFIQKHLSSLNTSDFIFCVVGNNSIEDYLSDLLASNVIDKPTFFIWVEPFLIGGHILYVIPQTAFKFKDLEHDGFYKYNVISKQTYLDKRNSILLREAGCQGSYTPYGKEAILRFFSTVITEVYSTIQNPPRQSFALTFLGDKNIAQIAGIELSDYATSSKNNLIKNLL